MSWVDDARRSAQDRVGHFDGGLRVSIQKLLTTSDRMASTTSVAIDQENDFANVPALEVDKQVEDKSGALRRVRMISIAGADLPGADLTEGRWRLTFSNGRYFVIPGPITAEGPTGSPIMWRFPWAEGAAA